MAKTLLSAFLGPVVFGAAATYDFYPTSCAVGFLPSPGAPKCVVSLDIQTESYVDAEGACSASGGHLIVVENPAEKLAVQTRCTSSSKQASWLGFYFTVSDGSVSFPTTEQVTFYTAGGNNQLPTGLAWVQELTGGARDMWSFTPSTRFTQDGLFWPPPVILPLPFDRDKPMPAVNATCVRVRSPPSLLPWQSVNATLDVAACVGTVRAYPCCQVASGRLSPTPVQRTNQPPVLYGVQRPDYLIRTDLSIAPVPLAALLPSPFDPPTRGSPSDPVLVRVPVDEGGYPNILLYVWAQDPDPPTYPAGQVQMNMTCDRPGVFTLEARLGWVQVAPGVVLSTLVNVRVTCTLSVQDGLGSPAARTLTVTMWMTRGFPRIILPGRTGWSSWDSAPFPSFPAGTAYSKRTYLLTEGISITYADQIAVCQGQGGYLPSPETAWDLFLMYSAAAGAETFPGGSDFLGMARGVSGNASCPWSYPGAGVADSLAQACLLLQMLPTVCPAYGCVGPFTAPAPGSNQDCVSASFQPTYFLPPPSSQQALVAPAFCTATSNYVLCEQQNIVLSYQGNTAPVVLPYPPRGTIPYQPSNQGPLNATRPVAQGVSLGPWSFDCSPGSGTVLPGPFCEEGWALYVPDFTAAGTALLNLAFLAADADSALPFAYRAGTLMYSLGPWLGTLTEAGTLLPDGLATTTAVLSSAQLNVTLSVLNPVGDLVLNSAVVGNWRNASVGWGALRVQVADAWGAPANGSALLHVVVLGCDAACAPGTWEAVPCTGLSNRVCLPTTLSTLPRSMLLLGVRVEGALGTAAPAADMRVPGNVGFTFNAADIDGEASRALTVALPVGGILVAVCLLLSALVRGLQMVGSAKAGGNHEPQAGADSISARVWRALTYTVAVYPSSVMSSARSAVRRPAAAGTRKPVITRTWTWLLGSVVVGMVSLLLGAAICVALLHARVLQDTDRDILVTAGYRDALQPPGSTWALPIFAQQNARLQAAGLLTASARIPMAPWARYCLPADDGTVALLVLALLLHGVAMCFHARSAATTPLSRRTLRMCSSGGSSNVGCCSPSFLLRALVVALDCTHARAGLGIVLYDYEADAQEYKQALQKAQDGGIQLVVVTSDSGSQALRPVAEDRRPEELSSSPRPLPASVPAPPPIPHPPVFTAFFLDVCLCVLTLASCQRVGILGSSVVFYALVSVLNICWTVSEDPLLALGHALTCCRLQRKVAKRRLSEVPVTNRLQMLAAAAKQAISELEAADAAIEYEQSTMTGASVEEVRLEQQSELGRKAADVPKAVMQPVPSASTPHEAAASPREARIQTMLGTGDKVQPVPIATGAAPPAAAHTAVSPRQRAADSSDVAAPVPAPLRAAIAAAVTQRLLSPAVTPREVQHEEQAEVQHKTPQWSRADAVSLVGSTAWDDPAAGAAESPRDRAAVAAGPVPGPSTAQQGGAAIRRVPVPVPIQAAPMQGGVYSMVSVAVTATSMDEDED